MAVLRGQVRRYREAISFVFEFVLGPTNRALRLGRPIRHRLQREHLYQLARSQTLFERVKMTVLAPGLGFDLMVRAEML